MHSSQVDIVERYPMGPKVRAWLGVSDNLYKGASNENPSAEDLEVFESHVLKHMEDVELANGEDLANLVEEFVGMNLPYLAIRLVDSYMSLFLQDDFRSQLHLGNACMMVGEFARAENCFQVAQRLIAEEPAPYVNLTQIYCQDRRFDLALQWCNAGLNIDANHVRLWEMLAWLYQQDDLKSTGEKVRSEAIKRHSWAGVSLGADLDNSDEQNVRGKLEALDVFYNEGLRDHDFLVEYTAVLGMAGQYEKIPAIIWQVEKQASKGLPWQLQLHCIQAFMGLGRDDQALEVLERVSKEAGIPPQGREVLEALHQELEAARQV